MGDLIDMFISNYGWSRLSLEAWHEFSFMQQWVEVGSHVSLLLTSSLVTKMAAIIAAICLSIFARLLNMCKFTRIDIYDVWDSTHSKELYVNSITSAHGLSL